MGLIKEFKEFAIKGNAVDMAVGIIIGAAFGKIVTSIIEDLIMPIVGKAVGNVDFSNLYFPLSDKITPGMPLVDARKVGAVFAYGNFITILINFLIVAFAVFMLVKGINALKRAEGVAGSVPQPKPAQEVLLEEIRDILKTK